MVAINVRAAVAELVAMFLFVLSSCGSATRMAGTHRWELHVALTFGFAITSLAYTIGHHSGAQINCAVTFGLVLHRELSVVQGLLNFGGQIIGSVLGAAAIALVVPIDQDKTRGLGTNLVNPAFAPWQALCGEIFMTFFLMYVVLETAFCDLSKPFRVNAGIPIGFAVFVAHAILIPIDGCSINPTRSLGPPIIASIRYNFGISYFDYHWIFWIGPLVGSSLAVGVYTAISRFPIDKPTKKQDTMTNPVEPPGEKQDTTCKQDEAADEKQDATNNQVEPPLEKQDATSNQVEPPVAVLSI
eukprot:TRINITY_DN20968_c0_g1_i1.p1 TRINITY_DN20968_c0_g1~~TRINITY_DN20968_c0_g1_i1.p1  ORF type:complete len:300 (-),score=28.76 TRINITY_DN20968_c0_g1_i1:127-1026(-)